MNPGAAPHRSHGVVAMRWQAFTAGKDAATYEEFLDRLRLFGQESLFLIGTRILSGTVTAQQASISRAITASFGMISPLAALLCRKLAILASGVT